MAEDFDPYHKWLGIPPQEQPPHHYRLLGVPAFESDPDVIENAADRQMAHVRTFQLGRHAALSQRVLGEIAAARVALLHPDKKRAYDAELKRKLSPAPSLAAAAAPPQPVAPVHEFPLPPPSRPRATAKGATPPLWRSPVVLGGAAAGLLLLAALALLASLNGDNSEDPHSQDDPPPLVSVENGEAMPQAAPAPAAETPPAAADKADMSGPAQQWVFTFDDRPHSEQHWLWNDPWTLGSDGGKAPPGPASYLRTRNEYQGRVSIDMDFSFSRARFSNTGGCWITVWGKRLLITNAPRQLHARIHIHREGDEIVFIHNGREERVAVDPEEGAKPTAIEVRWRSRGAHFRRIEIQADELVPAG